MSATFTTPVGRLIGGSVYTPKTTDQYGNPLVVKFGANKGQPTQKFDFGVAIPKVDGNHWAHTEWGAIIWAEAHKAWTQGETQRTDFSWKIIDGDSQVPNKAQKRPCDQEGYPGHWVLWFSSSFAPNLYSLLNGNQPQELLEPNAIYPGCWVQVAGSVAGNSNQQTPGIYLNHSMVCMLYHGDRISAGPNVTEAGFGGQQMPQGASTAPPAGFNPAPPQAAPPGAPPAAAAPSAPGGAGAPPTQPPGAPAAPQAPAAPSAPSAGTVPGAPSAAAAPGGQQFLAGSPPPPPQ